MVNNVKVYVEGGGGRELRARCRKGFMAFFGKLGLPTSALSVVPSDDRGSAFKRFRTEWLNAGPNQTPVLLVDSEGPVAEGTASWRHLEDCDDWDRPSNATDSHAHLMVESMESWFLADRDALARHFGPRFAARALPANPRIEEVAKDDVLGGLRKATRPAGKEYDKGRDSYAILGELDPDAVRRASPHVARLYDALRHHVAR